LACGYHYGRVGFVRFGHDHAYATAKHLPRSADADFIQCARVLIAYAGVALLYNLFGVADDKRPL
jgi:hypothetical protein